MKSNQNKYVEEVINGFQLNRGRASVYCFPPIQFADLIIKLIDQFYTKSPNEQVFIAVDNYNTRKAIADKIAKSSNNYNVKILSSDYIKTSYKYEYKLIISVGINDNIPIIEFLSKQCKFMLTILTKNIMDSEFIHYIRNLLPEINTSITDVSVRNDQIYSPVEEHRVGVELDQDARDLYEKYNEYISTSISIFGELSNIEKCRLGDPVFNISSAEFRESLARDNGWSADLDVSNDFAKQIDDIYNPNILFERANNFYNIVRQRRELITDYRNKLNAILDICVEHRGKRILIVSKRGEFAASITQYINENSDIKCADYHDTIEKSPAVDSYGKPIFIKSGKSKGQVKMLGAQALSTLNLRRFNDSEVDVLSIKNSSSMELKTTVDLIIYSTGFVDGIIELKTRFTHVDFDITPTINYKVYCVGTIEHKHLIDQKETPLIAIIGNNDNFIGYAETNDSIIL